MSKKIINSESLKEYIPKNNWTLVFNSYPASGLNFRNKIDYINLGCVASGVYSGSINKHCAGLDHVSYSPEEDTFKIDRSAIYKKEEKFEIKHIDKNQYSDIHHIKDEKTLIEKFPILGNVYSGSFFENLRKMKK